MYQKLDIEVMFACIQYHRKNGILFHDIYFVVWKKYKNDVISGEKLKRSIETPVSLYFIQDCCREKLSHCS